MKGVNWIGTMSNLSQLIGSECVDISKVTDALIEPEYDPEYLMEEYLKDAHVERSVADAIADRPAAPSQAEIGGNVNIERPHILFATSFATSFGQEDEKSMRTWAAIFVPDGFACELPLNVIESVEKELDHVSEILHVHYDLSRPSIADAETSSARLALASTVFDTMLAQVLSGRSRTGEGYTVKLGECAWSQVSMEDLIRSLHKIPKPSYFAVQSSNRSIAAPTLRTDPYFVPGSGPRVTLENKYDAYGGEECSVM